MLIKIVIWVFGLLVSVVPLITSIAPAPARLDAIFEAASYLRHFGAILFIGVTTCAVAIAETLEALIDESRRSSMRVASILILGLFVIIELVLLGIWYGRSVEPSVQVSVDDVRAAVVVVAIVLAEVMVLKMISWMPHRSSRWL